MSFNIEDLQQEQAEWSLHNFGEQPSYYALLGIVEEVGELNQALFSYLSLEATWNNLCGEIEDAIGDVTVFAAHYCSHQEWYFKNLYDDAHQGGSRYKDNLNEKTQHAETDALLKKLSVAVGKLSHHHLKAAQGIRGDAQQHISHGLDRMRDVVSCLYRLCDLYGMNYEEVVGKVWGTVKQRDWSKDKHNGGE